MTPAMTPDFTVSLSEVFQGPMDLLLHLVREQEVEIHEVEISRVIEGYFDYMKQLENLDIEVAGEFLVMAATLMSIKSRSLLPRDEIELEDELDPGDELIQRLIEYRRFKEASDDLDYRRKGRSLVEGRGYKKEVKDVEPERTLDLGELSAWDLLSTFSRLMRETLANRTHHIKGDPRPLRWYVSTVGEQLRAGGRTSLRDLVSKFEEVPTREGLVGAFCALLELMRIGVLTAEQERQEGEIVLSLRQDAGSDFERLISSAQFMDEQGAVEEGGLKGSDELPEQGADGPEPPVEPRDTPPGPADDAPGAKGESGEAGA